MKPLAAVVALVLVGPARAWAEGPPGSQLAVTVGLDGGVTVANPDTRLVDPTAHVTSVKPTVGLGIDVGFYYLPVDALGLGFKFSPVLFGAGQLPSYGINFAIGPGLVWRPGPVQVVVDPALVLSAYEDGCSEGFTARPARCVTPQKAAPTAVGYGGALSVLVPFYRHPFGLELLVGPTVRYHRARFDYQDTPGTMDVSFFQAVLGVHGFIHFDPSNTTPLPPG